MFAELPKNRCTLTMLTGPSPGALYTLHGDEVVVGRDEDLSWRIDDRGVSGRHARICHRNRQFWVEDLGSTNGTYVGGQRIEAPRELRDGDHIELGERTLIRVSLQDEREHEAARRMYEAAVLDGLTGVYNRGHLETVLESEYAYAVRHRSPVSVIFVDLDHFTNVNNSYGHQAGDAALRTVAQVLAEAIRTEDLLARYGGEEFVLVARGIDLNGSIAMAGRLRQIVEQTAIDVGGELISVTASFGVAAYEAATPYQSVQELVAAADRAVYRAKSEGRNRVCEAFDTSPESWRAGEG